MTQPLPINDRFFRVEVDFEASSPKPQTSIWRGQHQCVIEGFACDDEPPTDRRCGEIIIKHQLAGNRGHYSVLKHGFIKFDCGGFPHSVVAQLTRHQDSHFLVQSNRYTGDRFVKVARGELDVEEVFYVRPVGKYADRKGDRYTMTEERRERRLSHCYNACVLYAQEMAEGSVEEDSRGGIPYDFRQNFTISGTFEAFWHWLDQRTKKDSQLEIQTLAAMCFDKSLSKAPELMQWYQENRYGKAILAP